MLFSFGVEGKKKCKCHSVTKLIGKKQMELCGVVITLFYLLKAIIIEMNTNKVYYCQLRKCHGQKFSVDNFQVTLFPQKDSFTLLIYINSPVV